MAFVASRVTNSAKYDEALRTVLEGKKSQEIWELSQEQKHALKINWLCFPRDLVNPWFTKCGSVGERNEVKIDMYASRGRYVTHPWSKENQRNFARRGFSLGKRKRNQLLAGYPFSQIWFYQRSWLCKFDHLTEILKLTPTQHHSFFRNYPLYPFSCPERKGRTNEMTCVIPLGIIPGDSREVGRGGGKRDWSFKVMPGLEYFRRCFPPPPPPTPRLYSKQMNCVTHEKKLR